MRPLGWTRPGAICVQPPSPHVRVARTRRVGKRPRVRLLRQLEVRGHGEPAALINGAKMPPPLTIEREASILGGRGLVGRPTEIVEQLHALQQMTPGELHYIARLYWPGMDPGMQREAMEIFAEDVIPKLRPRLGPVAPADTRS